MESIFPTSYLLTSNITYKGMKKMQVYIIFLLFLLSHILFQTYLLLIDFLRRFYADITIMPRLIACPCNTLLTQRVSQNKTVLMCMFSRSFFADSSYMLSFSVLCSCVCSRLISPSVSSWHKQDNTLMHQSPGHIQRRTPYNF